MDSEGVQMLVYSIDFWKISLEPKSCQQRPLYLQVPCALYGGLRAALSQSVQLSCCGWKCGI